MNFCAAILKVLGPLLITPLVQYIEDGENPLEGKVQFFDFSGTWAAAFTPSKQYGVGLAALLLLTQGLSYILAENITFSQETIGVKTTNALIGLIYEKQLKLSPATNKEFSQGEIVTFVQVDAQKMLYLTSQLPQMAALPFLIIVCFAILFYHLGYTYFASIGAFLLFFFMNLKISKALAKVQKKYMVKLGARVSLITECLNNIKMIKLYAWDALFNKSIDENRKVEMRFLGKRMLYILLLMTVMAFFPLFL